MKYYSEKDLNEILDARDRRILRQTKTPIEVSFCRDCELFEQDYWQPNLETCIEGWCRGRSYYLTYDDEVPHYVYTDSNSFCDKRTIVNEQFIFSIVNSIIFNVV